MKTLQNLHLEKDGKPLIEANSGEPITTINCLKALLDNTAYENRGEQRKADRVYELLVSLGDAGSFDLEDADFQLLKGYAERYQPFLAGRAFSPILAQFED